MVYEYLQRLNLSLSGKNMTNRFKEIFNHSGFRRYFTNTSWLFAERVLRIIAGLFVGIYIARYLGPERFGIYSYSFAFAALFGAIAKLGLDSIAVRDLVNHSDKRDIYLGTVFWLKVVGGVLTLGIIGIAVRFISNDPTINIYIFIIASGLLFQSFEVVDFYFQSKVLSKYVSICKLTQLTLSSLLKLYFIFIRADLFWFVLVGLIDQMSLAISYVFAYWRQRIGMFFNHFQIRIAKEMLKNSWPMVFSGFSTMVLFRIDQLMIKGILSSKDVGQYAVAVQLSEVWYFVPMIVTSSLFPAVLNAQKASQKLYHDRLLRLNSLLAWTAIVIALPMTFLSGWLVTSLYGKAYGQSGQALMILIWSDVFVFLGNASKRWFLAENLQYLLLGRITLGVVSNVFLNIMLIPAYGIKGAAMATLVSYALTYYISYLFHPKLRFLFIMTTKSLHPRHLMDNWGK